jgi:hypothetical protein
MTTAAENKFLSVLESVGKECKKGLDVVLKIGTVAAPFLTAANPLAGSILSTTIGVVMQTEQKYAALGQQTGSGTQKLADATAILGPLLSQVLGDAGKPADATKVTTYINNVVATLNQTPATGPAIPPGTAVAAAAAAPAVTK